MSCHRTRVDDEALTSREMTVGDTAWPGWEMELGDTVYLWASLLDSGDPTLLAPISVGGTPGAAPGPFSLGSWLASTI